MLCWTRQPRGEAFSFFICQRWDHLQHNPIYYQDSHIGRAVQRLPSLSLWYYCPSVLHLFSLRCAASLCCTEWWKVYERGVTHFPMRVHYLMQWGTKRHRVVFTGGSHPQWDISLDSKERQKGCWYQKKCRSRVSDTKHNMVFIACRHLHNA